MKARPRIWAGVVVGALLLGASGCSTSHSSVTRTPVGTVDTVSTVGVRPGPQCPIAPLIPGPQARAGASAAARTFVTAKVGTSPGYDIAGYQITADAPALPEIARTTPDYLQRFKVSMLAYSWCGTAIGTRTYVVHVVFPEMLAARDGAAVSVMDLFESRLSSGWKVWDNYS